MLDGTSFRFFDLDTASDGFNPSKRHTASSVVSFAIERRRSESGISGRGCGPGLNIMQ